MFTNIKNKFVKSFKLVLIFSFIILFLEVPLTFSFLKSYQARQLCGGSIQSVHMPLTDASVNASVYSDPFLNQVLNWNLISKTPIDFHGCGNRIVAYELSPNDEKAIDLVSVLFLVTFVPVFILFIISLVIFLKIMLKNIILGFHLDRNGGDIYVP